MKQTFQITDPKIKPARRVDAIKSEIRKYLKRERRKELPEGFDFWDFHCSFGDTAGEKKEIHLAEVMTSIDEAASREVEGFYLEILAAPRKRLKKAGKMKDEI